MKPRPITVNMVSESEFSVQGHGVHTAYVEMTRALRERPEVLVGVNRTEAADVVHVQTMGPYAIRRLLSRKYRARFISAHLVPGSFVGSIVGAQFWARFSGAYLKFVYSRADRVLACSGLVARELAEMGVRNVGTFYNSIDMSAYATTPEDRRAAREALGIDEGEFVVVGNGQVQPRKRTDLFADMARAHPEIRFIWVGGIPFKNLGAEHGRMEKLIQDAPENLTFTGVLPLEDVGQYYQAADVFVLPSEQENHPMSVLEAAGASLPIVLRDIPNYEDTFGTDVALAAEDADFERLVLEIRDDAAVRDRYVRGAAEVARRFDSSEAAARLVEMYSEELARAAARRR